MKYVNKYINFDNQVENLAQGYQFGWIWYLILLQKTKIETLIVFCQENYKMLPSNSGAKEPCE